MIQFNDTLLNKNKAHLYTTSFDIEENGIYCLVGGNGLGKSTLINNFNKIEKPYPRTFLGKTQYLFNLKAMLGNNVDDMLNGFAGKYSQYSNEMLGIECLGHFYRNTMSEGERLYNNIDFFLSQIKHDSILCLDEIDSGLSDDRCTLVANEINNWYKNNTNSICIIASNHYSLYSNIDNPIYISMVTGKRINIDNYEKWLQVLNEMSSLKDIQEVKAKLFGESEEDDTEEY